MTQLPAREMVTNPTPMLCVINALFPQPSGDVHGGKLCLRSKPQRYCVEMHRPGARLGPLLAVFTLQNVSYKH